MLALNRNHGLGVRADILRIGLEICQSLAPARPVGPAGKGASKRLNLLFRVGGQRVAQGIGLHRAVAVEKNISNIE